jgi:hypothetical protein
MPETYVQQLNRVDVKPGSWSEELPPATRLRMFRLPQQQATKCCSRICWGDRQFYWSLPKRPRPLLHPTKRLRAKAKVRMQKNENFKFYCHQTAATSSPCPVVSCGGVSRSTHLMRRWLPASTVNRNGRCTAPMRPGVDHTRPPCST